jgi:hypothetical protein
MTIKKKDNKAISYEYDEFSNMLIKAAPFDFSTFNIHCPNSQSRYFGTTNFNIVSGLSGLTSSDFILWL